MKGRRTSRRTTRLPTSAASCARTYGAHSLALLVQFADSNRLWHGRARSTQAASHVCRAECHNAMRMLTRPCGTWPSGTHHRVSVPTVAGTWKEKLSEMPRCVDTEQTTWSYIDTDIQRRTATKSQKQEATGNETCMRAHRQRDGKVHRRWDREWEVRSCRMWD